MNFNKTNRTKVSYFFAPILLILSNFLLTSCGGSLNRSTPLNFENQKKAEFWHYAKTFLGTPYRFGGASRYGMDCSGLVLRVYNDVYGIKLPHNTYKLYKRGRTIPLRNLKIGDLVFFSEKQRNRLSHVGIYMGNGYFIHASSSSGVIMSRLNSRYYKKHCIGAKRIGR